MKVLEGEFPDYVMVCDCDHQSIKRLIFTVSWQDDTSLWIPTNSAINVILSEIGVFFDVFQESIAEAITVYERNNEVANNRRMFEVVQ
jgi:hypothetical protein